MPQPYKTPKASIIDFTDYCCHHLRWPSTQYNESCAMMFYGIIAHFQNSIMGSQIIVTVNKAQ